MVFFCAPFYHVANLTGRFAYDGYEEQGLAEGIFQGCVGALFGIATLPIALVAGPFIGAQAGLSQKKTFTDSLKEIHQKYFGKTVEKFKAHQANLFQKKFNPPKKSNRSGNSEITENLSQLENQESSKEQSEKFELPSISILKRSYGFLKNLLLDTTDTKNETNQKNESKQEIGADSKDEIVENKVPEIKTTENHGKNVSLTSLAQLRDESIAYLDQQLLKVKCLLADSDKNNGGLLKAKGLLDELSEGQNNTFYKAHRIQINIMYAEYYYKSGMKQLFKDTIKVVARLINKNSNKKKYKVSDSLKNSDFKDAKFFIANMVSELSKHGKGKEEDQANNLNALKSYLYLLSQIENIEDRDCLCAYLNDQVISYIDNINLYDLSEEDYNLLEKFFFLSKCNNSIIKFTSLLSNNYRDKSFSFYDSVFESLIKNNINRYDKYKFILSNIHFQKLYLEPIDVSDPNFIRSWNYLNSIERNSEYYNQSQLLLAEICRSLKYHDQSFVYVSNISKGDPKVDYEVVEEIKACMIIHLFEKIKLTEELKGNLSSYLNILLGKIKDKEQKNLMSQKIIAIKSNIEAKEPKSFELHEEIISIQENSPILEKIETDIQKQLKELKEKKEKLRQSILDKTEAYITNRKAKTIYKIKDQIFPKDSEERTKYLEKLRFHLQFSDHLPVKKQIDEGLREFKPGWFQTKNAEGKDGSLQTVLQESKKLLLTQM